MTWTEALASANRRALETQTRHAVWKSRLTCRWYACPARQARRDAEFLNAVDRRETP